jgi:hypothetical protein
LVPAVCRCRSSQSSSPLLKMDQILCLYRSPLASRPRGPSADVTGLACFVTGPRIDAAGAQQTCGEPRRQGVLSCQVNISAWASTGAADRTSRKSPQRGVDRIVGPEAQGRAQRVGRHLADRRRTKLDPPALDACGGEKQGFGRIEPGRDFDGHDPVRLDMSNERPRRRDIIQGRSTGRRTGRSRGSPN